jgi:E3 ubiquitin-protein ligase RNF5
MQVQSHCRVCPVCKAGIDDEKNCIPIYGRGGDNADPRKKMGGAEQPADSKDASDAVPRRPAGQRPAPVQRGGYGQGGGNMNMQPGLGIIPTLFGFQQNQGQGGYTEPLTPEQQHQAFLSRLLLMLGSFVIMCLLLF